MAARVRAVWREVTFAPLTALVSCSPELLLDLLDLSPFVYLFLSFFRGGFARYDTL